MNGHSLPQEVSGMRLRLRLVQPEDAEYIHGLRVDPTYNAHLSQVTGTPEDQRRWIEAYRTREAAGQEGYYVIERLYDGRRCGVVRLYDIDGDHFTWGSWILDANKPFKAALESAILIYRIGFETLGLDRAVFDVRKQNSHTSAFHRRFGAQEVGQDDLNIYFEYHRARYLSDIDRYQATLGGERPQ